MNLQRARNLEPAQIERARERFLQMPYAQLLGVSIETLEHEHAVLRLPHDPVHDNLNGSINGGATASLINLAGALAAWTGIDLSDDRSSTKPMSCIDLSIQYLAAGFGEDVLADARVLRRGRDLFFLEVSLSTPSGTAICQGLMTYRSPDYGLNQPRYFDGYSPRPAPAKLYPRQEAVMLQGFGEKLQMSLGDVAAGYGSLKLACPQSNTDGFGQVHEGAIASLVDFAGGITAWTQVTYSPEMRGATVGMQLAYARPARGAVIARAFLEHRSEEAFLSTVAVTDQASGELVCTGKVSYRLIEPFPASPVH